MTDFPLSDARAAEPREERAHAGTCFCGAVAIEAALRPAILDRDVAALLETSLRKALPDRIDLAGLPIRAAEEADHWQARRLRPTSRGPRSSRPKKRNELPPPHG